MIKQTLIKRLEILERSHKDKLSRGKHTFFTEIVTYSGIIIKQLKNKFWNKTNDKIILGPDMGARESKLIEEFKYELENN